jgi:FKBP-type peptidyl-prolyl cis-trans isomerase
VRAARRAAERRRRNAWFAGTLAAIVVIGLVVLLANKVGQGNSTTPKGTTFNCPAPTATPVGPQPASTPNPHPPALPTSAKLQTLQATYPDANGATQTAAMQYAIVQQGCGSSVKKDDNVTVIYTGWTQADGKEFDSSLSHGGTFQVQLVNDPTGQANAQTGVISGWNNGLIGMKPGETRRLIIPPALGYGSQAQTDQTTGKVTIPANSTLIFDITLVSIDGNGG